MNIKEIGKYAKKFWKWTWESDSIWSWVIALVLIFVFVKIIFFGSLSLIMGTSLPLAGVESSSMDHQITKDDYGILGLCGQRYSKETKKYIDFNDYWEICGDWYEEKSITKDIFSQFSLQNGFRKGDIIVIWGRFEPRIGDIIVFKPNSESKAPRPIIHRIVSINNEIIQTKGDHNQKQLTMENNIYKTDETSIKQEQIIGKAILKIPYLGWVKIIFSEMIGKFTA